MRLISVMAIALAAAACTPQEDAYNTWIEDDASFASELAAAPGDPQYAFLIADRYVATRGDTITFSLSTQPLIMGRSRTALVITDGGPADVCPPMPNTPCMNVTGQASVAGPRDLVDGEGSVTLAVPADWPHDGAFVQTITFGKGDVFTSNVLYIPVVDPS